MTGEIVRLPSRPLTETDDMRDQLTWADDTLAELRDQVDSLFEVVHQILQTTGEGGRPHDRREEAFEYYGRASQAAHGLRHNLASLRAAVDAAGEGDRP